MGRVGFLKTKYYNSTGTDKRVIDREVGAYDRLIQYVGQLIDRLLIQSDNTKSQSCTSYITLHEVIDSKIIFQNC